jgi:large subunit ribosomal protein L19
MAKAAAKSTKSGKASSAKKSAVKVKKASKAPATGETDVIRRVTAKKTKANPKIQDFGPGDTLAVYVKVREGDKERVQLYRGVCIKVQGKGSTRSFTVRKISSGVGVERTFPMMSPSLDRVEVVSRGQVRRSKLYYLRDLKGKAARLTSELVVADDSSETAAAEGEAQG